MTRTQPTEPSPLTRQAAAEACFDATLHATWQPALRFAAELDGAPQRCKRRACKRAKGCCMEWEAGKPLDCGGGALSPETIRMAGALSLFAAHMVQSHLEEVSLPHHRQFLARLETTYGVPLHL